MFTEQTARTTADTVTASQINGLSASTGNAFSAVQSEATARSTQDTALASSITVLSSQVNDPTTGLPATRAELSTNYLTSADTENAIAQSATFLRAYANIQSKVFRQADNPLKRGVDPETFDDIPLEIGDVWYDTNDSNKLYLWSGTAWVYSPDAVITGSVTAVDSRVTTVENTKIGYCTIGGVASDDTNKVDCEAAGGTWNVGIPIATAVKQVSVSDGADSATLEQRFTAQKTLNDGLQAQYTIKLDVNGNVAGYGVYADATGSSEFIANVNRFAVTTPQTSIALRATSTTYTQGAIVRVAGQDSKTLVCKIGGSTGTGSIVVGNIGTMVVDGSVTWQVASRVPFAVQAVPTNINGQPVPAGVYIDAAYVLNATIQNAQIADLAIDNQKIVDLDVSKLRAGSIDVGSYIQSTNYSPGTQGWRIHGNGFAEFGAAAIRGQLTAAQIDSRGLTIRTAAGAVILNAGSSEFLGNVTGTVNGTTASTLVSTANTALSTANTASSNATTALAQLTDIASDNLLTPGEKPTVIADYGVITSEQAGIDAQAGSYGITTQRTAYNNAVAALTTYLGTLTTPVVWNNLSGNTNIVGTTFRSRFSTVYTTRQALLDAISARAKVLADTAQGSANTAQGTANTALSTANTANSTANSALSGLTTKLNSNAQNALAGAGGLSVGTLTWNSSGVRTGGYGVGFSANGLAAYNTSGAVTFALNASNGNATFAGTLSGATGRFDGALFAATGTFSGTLTADAISAVNTINIAGNAVTVPTVYSRYVEANGNPAGQNYLETNITMDQTGYVYASVSLSQGFPSGFTSWQGILYIGDTPVFVSAGSRPGDSISLSGAAIVYVNPGETVNVNVRLLHTAPSNMVVVQGTLFVMGSKR